jgi:hypothetical protein
VTEPELGERMRQPIEFRGDVTLDEVLSRVGRPYRPKRRLGRLGKAAPVLVAAGVAAAAVVLFTVPGNSRPKRTVDVATQPPTPTPTPSSTTPSTAAPSTTALPLPSPVPTNPAPTTFLVPGYSTSSAAAAVKSCLDSVSLADTAGYTLRAAFPDSYGTVLVFTSGSGWSTCELSTSGAVVGGAASVPRTYASVDGWGFAAPPPGDAPASWLLNPADLLSSGGGVVTLPSGGGFLWTVEGRAAFGITEVKVGLPDGTLAPAPVQNGIFVARKLFPSDPVSDTPVSVPRS